MSRGTMYDDDFLRRVETRLRAALPRWGLSAASELHLLVISENATFRARDLAAGNDVILRVHRPGYHSRAEIASELAWLDALGKDGVVPVPTPVPQIDGERIAELDDDGATRHVVAFVPLPGAAPAEGADLPRWFRALGAINARLHAHARAWRRPEGFVRKRWDFDAMLGQGRLWGDWRAAIGLDRDGTRVLERTSELLRSLLDAYGTGADRFGLVHADMRIANLLVDGDNLSVIDFDDCGFGWYLYDFAAAVSFIEHEPFIPELQAAWTEGYRSVAPLADEECAVLPVFVMLRRMLLTAWVASHSETPTARQMGTAYTRGTVGLARAFLRTHGGSRVNGRAAEVAS